jgi:hypothetical protein
MPKHNHEIEAEDLTPGAVVMIQGTITYSQLRTPISGQQLVERNKFRKHPAVMPYTTITIGDAAVLPNPANPEPTTEEKFVAERLYIPAKHPEHGLSYTVDSKGSLPQILVRNEQGHYAADTSTEELANGLNVTLVLRFYASKKYPDGKRGVSVAQVLVNEPVRYYTRSGVEADELAARGIVIDGPLPAATPITEDPVQTPEQAAPAAPAPVVPTGTGTGTVIDENGFAGPAPVAATPAPAPAQAPVPVSDPAAEQIARLKAELARLEQPTPAPQAPAPVAASASAMGSSNPWDEMDTNGIVAPGH